MDVIDELQHMLHQLSPQCEHVSLRGQGRARFVFAQHKGRALEISESDGNWWLEFWDADPDLDAAPVKELTLQTARQAEKEAIDWLGCGPRQPVLLEHEAPRP
jgi:hypothetical protein